MYHIALLHDRTFCANLTRFDQDLAADVRARGCPCGGRLHTADYPRKPRGGSADLGPAYAWRLPGAVLERFAGTIDAECLQRLLAFLAPLPVSGARSSGPS